jgi:TonB family protein
MLAVAFPLCADESTYEQRFVDEVTEFANHNRLNIARLNRDVHANCYIPVTVTAVISADGSLKDVSIAESSTVPVVDRYFLYVIQQAAPFEPLEGHFEPVPEDITITREFRLDARLWGQGIRSTRPCEKLEPREPRSD